MSVQRNHIEGQGLTDLLQESHVPAGTMAEPKVLADDDFCCPKTVTEDASGELFWGRLRQFRGKRQNESRVDAEFCDQRKPLFKSRQARRWITGSQDLRRIRPEGQHNTRHPKHRGPRHRMTDEFTVAGQSVGTASTSFQMSTWVILPLPLK